MDLELEEFICLVGVLLLAGAVVGHQFWYQTETQIFEVEKIIEVPVPYPVPEIIREVQVVEIPFFIERTNYTIIEIPVPAYEPFEVENVIIIEKLVDKVRNFENMEELFAFIKADKTDELGYSKRFNCMDFAMTTADNAMSLGYRVTFLYSYNLETQKAHALNMAYVKSSAKWMVWDPQTDEIQWGWLSRITEGVD